MTELFRLSRICKDFERPGERTKRVLDDLSLSVHENEFVSVLGPSGVGKTTLLNLIAGLESPTVGTVEFNASVVKDVSKIGFLFQSPALMQWRTVLENVTLPLEIAGVKRSEARADAMRALRGVGLLDVADSYPSALSGGMKARVAVARAMIQNPKVLLMDEPFSSLDPIMRETYDINLMRYCEKRNVTGVFVTHSVMEACLVAHVVVVLDKGKIVERIPVDVPWPRTRDALVDAQFISTVKHVHEVLLKTSMADLMPKPEFVKEEQAFVDEREPLRSSLLFQTFEDE